MVGHLPLKQVTVVRVHAGQHMSNKKGSYERKNWAKRITKTRPVGKHLTMTCLRCGVVSARHSPRQLYCGQNKKTGCSYLVIQENKKAYNVNYNKSYYSLNREAILKRLKCKLQSKIGQIRESTLKKDLSQKSVLKKSEPS